MNINIRQAMRQTGKTSFNQNYLPVWRPEPFEFPLDDGCVGAGELGRAVPLGIGTFTANVGNMLLPTMLCVVEGRGGGGGGPLRVVIPKRPPLPCM